MKRTLTWLLVMAFLFSLCACEKTNTADETTIDQAIVVPKVDKNAPSSELIQADVETALEGKNTYATLTSIDIIKSLTTDTSYKATLALTAQTKYASFTYEAEVTYTKYDQGWILDKTIWGTESHSIYHIPTTDEMTAIAQTDEYLNGPIIDSHTLSFQITDIVDSNTDQETLCCYSMQESEYLHATGNRKAKTQWYYQPMTDNWVCTSSESLEYTVTPQCNLSGIWTDGYGSLEILSFSADKIEAKLDGKEDILTFIASDESSYWKNWYVGTDYCLAINYQVAYSSIYLYTSSNTVYAAFPITQPLPPL